MIVGMGSHIVEVVRIVRVINRYGEQFLTRIYSNDEISACHVRSETMHSFAEYWAAKEAAMIVLSAVPGRGLGWKDVEVVAGARRQHVIRLHGNARDLASALDIDEILVSPAHCRTYATATAIGIRH